MLIKFAWLKDEKEMEKRKIFLLIGALMAVMAISARTISDFFVSEDNGLFVLVESKVRMDLLDYSAVGRKVHARNSLEGRTWLGDVTPNYIKVNMSRGNVVELGLIELSAKDSIIVVTNTVELPAEDSQISFYDTSWKKIENKKIIKEPKIEDFVRIPAGEKMKKEEVTKSFPFSLISYHLNKDLKLVARQNMKKFLGSEEYKKVQPYMIDSIVYELKQGKYRPGVRP